MLPLYGREFINLDLSDPDYWDDPSKFVWFVGGWGPDRDRYIANAIRKLRPMLREDAESTLDMRFDSRKVKSFGTGQPYEHVIEGDWEDVVDQLDKDGKFPWGDFPWGGAVTVIMGDMVLVGAMSCLHEIDDDTVMRTFLRLLGKQIILHDDYGKLFDY